MISIITVVWNDYDFADLLFESVSHFSELPYQIIVIDNSERPKILSKVTQVITGKNIGHGKGLNLGVEKALALYPDNSYVMFVDSDCHFILHGWDKELVKKTKNYDLIGGKGVPAKPVRPACMFMKKELANNDWSDTENYRGHRVTPDGFDVAIQAYHKLVSEKKSILLLDHQPSQYNTLNGEEFIIDNKPFLYHHWHGSHLRERQVDFPNDNLLDDKNKLFRSIPWRLI